ncbi:hypothetical protein F2Q69_00009534 [Brassica cretica]|uniref:Transmembrane protein n=1 Tax=Brassica cretica TaxID=69181 RepID=A0A8S9P544_BRACR|nr:hypothetical protein F2Q69_00009534 [Brassica cretica]
MSLREEAFTALSSPAVDPGGGGFLRSALPAFGYSSVIFVLMKMKVLWLSETRVYSRWWDVELRVMMFPAGFWWFVVLMRLFSGVKLRSVEAWRRSLAFDTCLSLPPSENTFRIRVF